MAALSAARLTQSRNVEKYGYRKYKMAGSTTIYEGSLVMLKSDGYATPAAATAGNLGCIGVATETVANSGADGAASVKVAAGEFLLAGTSIAQASVGLPVFAEDDQTVDETQGSNEPIVGLLVEVVSSSSGWVLVAPEIGNTLAYIAATYSVDGHTHA